MGWPSGIPRNMTPAQRVERARNAAQARASVDGLIKSLKKKPLTAEQRAELAALASEVGS